MTVEMHAKPWADVNWLKKSDARGDILSFYASALYLPNILQCRSVAGVQAIERLVV